MLQVERSVIPGARSLREKARPAKHKTEHQKQQPDALKPSAMLVPSAHLGDMAKSAQQQMTMARHSRVQSSTTTKMRSRRPSTN